MIDEIKKLNLPFGVWQVFAWNKLTNRGIKCGKISVNYPDANTMEFVIAEIASFKLSFMYGCKGILISHATFIQPAYRDKKISYLLQEIKARIAADLLATVLIATVRSDNIPEQKVVRKFGWKKVFKFKNIRTKNSVDFVFKENKNVE